MRYVVVGGGVAGVCCAEELCRLCPDATVTLVSADRVLKGVSTVARITRNLEELKIEEKRLDELPYPNLRHVLGVASGIDTEGRRLLLAGHDPEPYDKLCICAGARPRRLADSSANVLTVRDTHSVDALRARLATARRVVVVGNGGIALELIEALQGVDVVWAMRHGHIGDAFFDVDAAQFLLEELQRRRAEGGGAAQQSSEGQSEQQQQGPPEPVGNGASEAAAVPPAREPAPGGAGMPPTGAGGGEKSGGRYSIRTGGLPGTLGHAVGPAWARHLALGRQGGSVTLEPGCEVASIEDLPADDSGNDSSGSGWQVAVTLTDGRRIEADLVVSAIGVTPATEWVPSHIERAPDGGLAVDREMETSAAGVYAAGDSATAAWPLAESRHWFQMRLWSQARAMGTYAAHCMAGLASATGSDMAFELFTHVTRFMGLKVVLLGLYNGQRLEGEAEGDIVTYCREGEAEEGHGHGGGCCGRHSPHGGGGRTFVRVLLLRGRVQGAVLIGETDLEEVFENLILDQLDVGAVGPALLDPEAELDHVFD